MYRSHVLICGGTGCTSSNSEKIIEKMKEEIKARGLENEVNVVRTGCFGLCALGPIMIVYPAVSPGARILSLKWSPPTASHPAYALPAGTPARFLTTAFGRSKLPPSPIKSCTVG